MNKTFLKKFADFAKKTPTSNDPFFNFNFDGDAKKFVAHIAFHKGLNNASHPIIKKLRDSGWERWSEDKHEYPHIKKSKKPVFYISKIDHDDWNEDIYVWADKLEDIENIFTKILNL
jgi:hypothetical protein